MSGKNSLTQFLYRITDRLVNLRMHRCGLTFHETDFTHFKIRYWDSGGNKPTLVLLQAFTAESKFTWRKQVRYLSKKYRLLLPNILYFGGSTAHAPDYSVNEQVVAIETLLEHLGITSYSLCGASYGGIIALELALKQIERVNKLIIIAAPVKFLTDADRNPVYERFGVNGKLQLLVPDNHHRAKKLLGIAYKNPPPVPLFIFKGIFDNIYVPQSEDRKKLLTRLENEQGIYDARDYHFPFPVLLVWGEEDQLVPIHVGKKLQEHIGANAKLEIIPNTAHLPNLERPRFFNELVLDFLDK